MSYIGIGSPIPDISNLPGQTGGEVEVTLDYPSSSACGDASPFLPSEATPAGGVFSASPAGLNLNTSTGEVTPVGSTPQAYTISYTVSGIISQFALTINAVQQSTFSYSSSSFQQIGTATPTLAGGTTLGGSFSAPAGVSINTSTGVIDLAASTIGGPYTITYTTPGPCASSSTFDISVTAVAVQLIDNNFAMEFSSADDTAINVASDVFGGMTNFSISAWFKMSVNNHDQPLIARWQTAPSGILLYWDYTNGWRILFQTDTGQKTFQSSIQSSGSGLPTVDVWYHLCVTYDGSNIKFYLNDGTTSETGSTTSGTLNSITDWQIGRDGPSLNRIFDGDIDEVAIWSKALELADVQRIYNATNDNPGKCANLFTAGLGTGLVFWNRMGD